MIEILIPTHNPPICDFCTGSPVTARYVVESFIIQTLTPMPIGSESLGDWAECVICEVLIDTNDWDGLVQHVTERFYENNPELKSTVPFPHLANEMRHLYKQLREHGFKKGTL